MRLVEMISQRKHAISEDSWKLGAYISTIGYIVDRVRDTAQITIPLGILSAFAWQRVHANLTSSSFRRYQRPLIRYLRRRRKL